VGTPVTLRERRRRAVLLTILGATFVVAGSFMVRDGRLVMGIVVLVLFGGGALYFLRVALMGGLWLRLDEAGFTITNGFATWTYGWQDVITFSPISFPTTTLVGFVLHPDAPNPSRGPLRALGSVFGTSLPSTYGGMNAEELTRYMEAWRTQFGGHRHNLSKA
jgi:Na+/proline symporter